MGQWMTDAPWLRLCPRWIRDRESLPHRGQEGQDGEDAEGRKIRRGNQDERWRMEKSGSKCAGCVEGSAPETEGELSGDRQGGADAAERLADGSRTPSLTFGDRTWHKQRIQTEL